MNCTGPLQKKRRRNWRNSILQLFERCESDWLPQSQAPEQLGVCCPAQGNLGRWTGTSPVLKSVLDINHALIPKPSLYGLNYCKVQLWEFLILCVSAVPLLSPGNLRVSEEWYNRFRVTWDPPQSPTMGYRIVYQPIYGTYVLSPTRRHLLWWKCRTTITDTPAHLLNSV